MRSADGAPAASAPARSRPHHTAQNNALAMIFTMAWHMTLPLVPVYAATLGASPFVVGLIVSSNVVLPLLLALHLGAAADRVGATRIARWAGAVFVVAYLIIVAGRNLTWLAVGLAGTGLADIALVMAAQTHVAVTSRPADRDRDFAHMALWMSAGALVGPVLGGVLTDRWGYTVSFAGALGLAVATCGLAWLMPTATGRLDATVSALRGVETVRRAAALMRTPSVASLLLMSAALMFGTSVRHSFLPLYLKSVGMSTTLIGIVFSLNSLCQMAVRPAIAVAVQRLRHAGVLAVALAITIAGVALTPWLTSFWPLAAAFSLIGAGTGVTQPLTMSLVSGHATPTTRGLALGVRMTVNQAAHVVAPPILGAAVGAFGLGASFHVAAAVAVLGFVWLGRFAHAERDSAGRVAASEPVAAGEPVGASEPIAVADESVADPPLQAAPRK
jgi:MFS family permease